MYSDKKALFFSLHAVMLVAAFLGFFLLWHPRISTFHPNWLYGMELIAIVLYYQTYYSLPLIAIDVDIHFTQYYIDYVIPGNLA